MSTRPNSKRTNHSAAENQDATTVASVKLDNVTGGWWYGPYGGPYGGWGGPGPYASYGAYGAYNPYAAARYAAYEQRRAQWYAANPPPRFSPWWGY